MNKATLLAAVNKSEGGNKEVQPRIIGDEMEKRGWRENWGEGGGGGLLRMFCPWMPVSVYTIQLKMLHSTIHDE